MFATIDPVRHATKRKRVTNVYSKSYLQSSLDLQAIVTEVIHNRLLPRLQQSTELKEGEDIMKIVQAVILDCGTGYSWGLGNGTQYVLDRKSHEDFHGMYLASRPPSMFFAQVELPTITGLLAKFGISSLEKDSFYHNDTVDAWCLRMCDGAEETIANGGKLEPGYNPTVYRQLKDAVAKEDLSPVPNMKVYRTSPLNFQRHQKISTDTEKVITKLRSAQQIDIAAELLDEIVATNDVLGNTMTYICWELSRRPEVQQRLRDEVRALMPTTSASSENKSLPNPKELDQLPLLHAVIMESMRRWPTNPGLEPRLTPENATLAGYHGLPAGVRVSASPHCLHNNPTVYPEPEAWRPERWMPKVEDRGQWAGNGQADRWFFGFSAGLRMCIGNQLSMHLMKFIVASMYANFTTSVVDDTGMDVQKDGFIAAMDADQLILKVERWT